MFRPAHAPSARTVAAAAAYVAAARVATVVAAALGTACSGARAPRPAPEPPAGMLYVRGPVATVAGAVRGAPAWVLVTPDRDGRGQCGLRASLSARTPVLRRTPAGITRRASLDEVRVGDTVEVYVNGPVALSCPAQGTASAVVLSGAGG